MTRQAPDTQPAPHAQSAPAAAPAPEPGSAAREPATSAPEPATPAPEPQSPAAARQSGLDRVRALADRCSNWGRWGEDDELGTLNHIRPEDVVAAARLVRSGRVISLSIPVDDAGPQTTGAAGRFNPIHLMLRTGDAAVTGSMVRDFYGGVDRHLFVTDDLLILPLQSGTQWDALGHVVFEGRMYNGYPGTDVASRGAIRNDIAKAAAGFVGRGVLLDVPRSQGRDSLDDGEAIHADDLDRCLEQQGGVTVGRGDIVLVRTGQIGRCRAQASWGAYAGGPAPGLALDTAPWLFDREVAAVATDTWGLEVRPNETPDVLQPLHIVLIAHAGLLLGEIFDLEALATDCAADGRYEFLLSAPPLVVTGGVGSPVNPVAIK